MAKAPDISSKRLISLDPEGWWVNMIDLIRDSPLYQDIIEQGILEGRELGRQEGLQQGMQQGLQQGVQQGLQQGLQQGRQEELQKTLFRLLARRVGPLSADLQADIRELTLEQAETLAEDLLDFKDLADLQQWLHRKTVH